LQSLRHTINDTEDEGIHSLYIYSVTDQIGYDCKLSSTISGLDYVKIDHMLRWEMKQGGVAQVGIYNIMWICPTLLTRQHPSHLGHYNKHLECSFTIGILEAQVVQKGHYKGTYNNKKCNKPTKKVPQRFILFFLLFITPFLANSFISLEKKTTPLWQCLLIPLLIHLQLSCLYVGATKSWGCSYPIQIKTLKGDIGNIILCFDKYNTLFVV